MAKSGRYMRCRECHKVYLESTVKARTGFCRCGSQKWINTNPTWLDKLLVKLTGR